MDQAFGNAYVGTAVVQIQCVNEGSINVVNRPRADLLNCIAQLSNSLFGCTLLHLHYFDLLEH